MSTPQTPNFGDSPIPFAGQQELIAQYTSGDYSNIIGGLLDPTEQRLHALAEFVFKKGDQEAGVQAMAELDDYYGQAWAIGSVASGGYLLVVDGSLPRSPLEGQDPAELAFHTAHSALAYLRAVLEMPRDHDVLTRLRFQQGSARAHSLLSIAPNNALGASMGLAGGDALKRLVSRPEPTPKWGRDVRKAVGLFMRIAEGSIDSPGTLNVAKMLGTVVQGCAEQAVKVSRESQYIEVPQPVRHNRTPRVAQVVAEVVPREIDDSHGQQIVTEFGLDPLSSKALKAHPLGGVLKKGGQVVLGKKYEFGGFGDNAGLAASFLDSLARIEDGKESEALELLLDRMCRASEVAGNGVSTAMRHQITSLLTLIQRCTEVDVCQVLANHAMPAHPTTRRIVERLTILRERLQLSV